MNFKLIGAQMRQIATIIFISFFVFQLHGQSFEEQDWFLNNKEGISAHEAYKTLLKNRNTRTVVVAVIDSGVDVDHEDLKENIWINTDEIPNNGIDDDKNGYIDDINGWNFIGGKDGKNVAEDSYEAARVYQMLAPKYQNISPSSITSKNKKEYELYLEVAEEVLSKRKVAEDNLEKMYTSKGFLKAVIAKLENSLAGKLLDQSSLDSLKELDDENIKPALYILKQYQAEVGAIPSVDELKLGIDYQYAESIQKNEKILKFSYNIEHNNREEIVGDNYQDGSEKIYGNADPEGPDALHGTHVSGIIGAIRNNDIGMNGVAQNVKIMSVRAVPDGDERDKDVANAIRYAVDNGASIINMSFGKDYSPFKDLVDNAIRYAEKKDVLLVHAAGNSSKDNDSTRNFPKDTFRKPKGFLFWKKKRVKNWIEVGALSLQSGEHMVAPFSNYGKKEVDLFAPGVQIYATLPNDQYRYLQGTSMASPVVAGVAAVIRSIYPSLTAVQVKEVLMKSSKKNTQIVIQPGTGEMVPFSDLSVSGGIVNLKNAVIMGARMKGKKKIKKRKVLIGV